MYGLDLASTAHGATSDGLCATQSHSDTSASSAERGERALPSASTLTCCFLSWWPPQNTSSFMFSGGVLFCGDGASKISSKKRLDLEVGVKTRWRQPRACSRTYLSKSPEVVCVQIFIAGSPQEQTQEGGAKLLEQIQSVRLPWKCTQN